MMDKHALKKIKDSDLFETLKHSKNYISAHVANKAIVFVSIPIFTRLFSESDYGVISVFTAYVGIMTVILSLDSYTAISRYYYEPKADFGGFIGTAFVFVTVIFCITISIYSAFYPQISAMMQLPGWLPVYLLFACFFAILYSMYYQTLVPQKKSGQAATVSVIKGFSTIGVTIIFAFIIKENKYMAQIWAVLLIGFVMSMYFIIKGADFVRLSFKPEHIKYIAAYSFPLIPYHLSSIILAQFDRIMINNAIGMKSAGLYSLGYNIGMVSLIVITSTQTALMPDFFRFMDNREHKRIDVLTKKIFSVIAVVSLGLVFFAREIVILLADEKFHGGLAVVPVVVVGYVFYTMATIYNRYISYVKKTVYLAAIVLTAGVLNIVWNLIYIPKYGYIAAAYTTVASYFVMFLLTWIVSAIILKQKVTPLWIIWRPTLIMFGFMALIYLLGTLGLNVFLFFAIKLIFLAIFCCVVLYRQIRAVLNLG